MGQSEIRDRGLRHAVDGRTDVERSLESARRVHRTLLRRDRPERYSTPKPAGSVDRTNRWEKSPEIVRKNVYDGSCGGCGGPRTFRRIAAKDGEEQRSHGRLSTDCDKATCRWEQIQTQITDVLGSLPTPWQRQSRSAVVENTRQGSRDNVATRSGTTGGIRAGLLNPHETDHKRPIDEHVDDFERHLVNEGRTKKHARLVASRV
jgi:hypothetical protein